MISPETCIQIRRYFYAEHWKIGTFAQALNVHPDTVRRAIEVERFRHAEAPLPVELLNVSILAPRTAVPRELVLVTWPIILCR